MSGTFQKIQEATEFLKQSFDNFVPDVGLVLGSGMGGYIDSCLGKVPGIPFVDIPHFPVSDVSGHAGLIYCGNTQGNPSCRLIISGGRPHYYEGFSPEQVVLPVCTMINSGAKIIILTCAVGAINPEFKPGNLVVISDHCSFFGPNPLRGPNDEKIGIRFPDMTEVYHPELRNLALDCLGQCGLPVLCGNLCILSGPSYETPFEISMLKKLGVDLVGMSTVLEAIAAVHMKVPVLALALVTNMAAGIEGPLDHGEVTQTAAENSDIFARVMNAILAGIPAELLKN